MTPFVVLSLPRSRSFWLSQFLSRSDRPVGHDISRRFISHDEIREYFAAPSAGAVDTALGLIWDRLGIAGVNTIILHRDPDEVARSLHALGMRASNLYAYDAKLRAMPGFHIHQADLDSEDGAALIYRYCTGHEMPRARWRDLIAQNLQCDVRAMEREVRANLAGLRQVFGEGAAPCR